MFLVLFQEINNELPLFLKWDKFLSLQLIARERKGESQEKHFIFKT